MYRVIQIITFTCMVLSLIVFITCLYLGEFRVVALLNIITHTILTYEFEILRRQDLLRKEYSKSIEFMV